MHVQPAAAEQPAASRSRKPETEAIENKAKQKTLNLNIVAFGSILK